MGGNGDDSLTGGEGNDDLWSYNGTDTLFGGAGADRFYFVDDAPASGGVDLIVDMTQGVDKIAIGEWWAASLAGQTSLSSSQFHAGSGFTEASSTSQRVFYDSNTGNLYFDADGSGSGFAPLLIAVLGNHSALSYQDFICYA